MVSFASIMEAAVKYHVLCQYVNVCSRIWFARHSLPRECCILAGAAQEEEKVSYDGKTGYGRLREEFTFAFSIYLWYRNNLLFRCVFDTVKSCGKLFLGWEMSATILMCILESCIFDGTSDITIPTSFRQEHKNAFTAKEKLWSQLYQNTDQPTIPSSLFPLPWVFFERSSICPCKTDS